jgi:DNA-binding GntR family transcriptional regulator
MIEVGDATALLPLSEQAFMQLRRDCISGKLAPGRKLKMDALQDAYGISSSPLREALNRLSQEGLVSADARRGFRVTPISYADLADVTHMRMMLEVAALRSSIEHGDVSWETGLLSAYHRLEHCESRLAWPAALDDAWSLLHRSFHLALIGGCPSGRQVTASISLFDQSERYRYFTARYRTVPRDKRHDHKKMLDAALSRNADLACTLLQAHIRGTLKNVKAALQLYEAEAA